MGTTFTNWVKQIVISFLILFTAILSAHSHAANYAPVIDLNAVKDSPASVRPIIHKSLNDDGFWVAPAHGRLVIPYSIQHHGLSIAGQAGDPVFAASSGEVLYAGDGLRGYGNLIIIKHDKWLLSAYAHNQKMLVKIGDWVNKGQKIAEMGNSDSKRVMLYFEIRKNGKPINPASIRGIM